MTAILNGVRILEVAEHTFVPVAPAALADLGSEVIKIEHVERGDAMRGLVLGTGLLAMGQAMALSLLLDMPWEAPSADRANSNPLTRNYRTKDDRELAFTCLQAGKYWPSLCDVGVTA